MSCDASERAAVTENCFFVTDALEPEWCFSGLRFFQGYVLFFSMVPFFSVVMSRGFFAVRVSPRKVDTHALE